MLNRRRLLQLAGASTGLLAASRIEAVSGKLYASESNTDSKPMQLFKSLSDEQREKVCMAVDHPRRQYINNWWYIHQDYRINNTFSAKQRELIEDIFDSLHRREYIEDVKKQVKIDQYGEDRYAPAVGFFGTPDDDDFEFIFTGHHVTRRCNAHSDQGTGFGGAPIFYGHYPHPLDEMRTNFHEKPEHPGNPYWYQGRVFNQFVQSLDADQQQAGLVSGEPRSESPDQVLRRTQKPTGLACSELSGEQKKALVETMRGMLEMFRESDAEATIETIEQNNVVDRLHVSWFDGKYDIGSDQVWDTWQIEGPDMVWYFRGQPHIHCYFHLKV